jgi:hypothetical protein
MFVFDKMPDPALGLGGLEPGLSTEEEAVQGAAHQFAREVMRPISMGWRKTTLWKSFCVTPLPHSLMTVRTISSPSKGRHGSASGTNTTAELP